MLAFAAAVLEFAFWTVFFVVFLYGWLGNPAAKLPDKSLDWHLHINSACKHKLPQNQGHVLVRRRHGGDLQLQNGIVSSTHAEEHTEEAEKAQA